MTHPFTIAGLDHVVIRTANLQRMLRFYEYALGCRVERTAEGLGLYQLRAGASLIDIVDAAGELGRRGGPPPANDGFNMDHFCIRIDPWDETAIRGCLAEHGVEAGPTAQRNGAEGMGPSIYIQDPDGNTVELKGPPNR